MDIVKIAIDFILHLDEHLIWIVENYGLITYIFLFGVIFAETGFVITPFLPGDSLLFAAGAIAAIGSLNVWLVVGILLIGAVLGDAANYWIGKLLGQKIVDNPRIPFINQEHIDKTEEFYKKHGGKTIILARFVPIIRTFAPFVAGVGKMDYGKFFSYNIIGGAVWVLIFTFLGYFFGNIPFIKDNFHYAIFVIIGLSLLPIIYEYIQSKRNAPSLPQKELEEVVND